MCPWLAASLIRWGSLGREQKIVVVLGTVVLDGLSVVVFSFFWKG